MKTDVIDCEICGEIETEMEPLGTFVGSDDRSKVSLAHGQCGEDAGMELG